MSSFPVDLAKYLPFAGAQMAPNPSLADLTSVDADDQVVVYRGGVPRLVAASALRGASWSPSVLGAALRAWFDPTVAGLVTGSPVSQVAAAKASLGRFGQGVVANRPAIASGVVTADGTNDFLEGGLGYELIDEALGPDGAGGSVAGKGPTLTGLAKAPDGTWYAGNHGQPSEATSGSDPYLSGVLHLSADRTALISEYRMSDFGLTPSSVQDVAYDSARNLVGFACPAGFIYVFNPVTRVLVDTIAFTNANGLTYDPVLHCWIATRNDGGVASWIDVQSHAVVKTLSLRMGTPDCLFFQPSYGSLGALWTSQGLNAMPGHKIRYDVETGTPTAQWLISELDAIEGFHVDEDGTSTDNNDAYFHNGTLNKSKRFKLLGMNAGDIGKKLTIAFVGHMIVAPSGSAKALVAGGDPTSTIHGAGLYFTSTANQMNVQVKTSAAAASASFSLPDVTTKFLCVAEVDVAAQTASVWVNGVFVATGALAGIGANNAVLRPLVWTLFAAQEGSPARWANAELSGLVVASLGGVAATRQTIEGYLAWQTGQAALLPSDHPYKNGRP